MQAAMIQVTGSGKVVLTAGVFKKSSCPGAGAAAKAVAK